MVDRAERRALGIIVIIVIVVVFSLGGVGVLVGSSVLGFVHLLLEGSGLGDFVVNVWVPDRHDLGLTLDPSLSS